MTLINEWILENDLIDTVGGKDLVAYGIGSVKHSNKSVELDGTYGLKTKENYPLPSNYTLSIIIDMTALSVGAQWSIIFGNGVGQSGVGYSSQGIIQTSDGDLSIFTGAGDGYSQTFIKMETNKRYHFIMTMSDAGYASFYINGKKVHHGQLATYTHNYPLTIGGFYNSPTASAGVTWSFLKAKVNNARLYDNVLNDDEALALYHYYLIKNRTLILHNGEYKKWNEKTPLTYTGNVIPIMTSNNTPLGVASASTSTTNYEAWKAFDGINNTELSSWANSTRNSEWIAYEFETKKIIGKYGIHPYAVNSRLYDPKSWDFEGYDGVNWVLLDSVSDYAFTANKLSEFEVTQNLASYIAYRLNLKETNGAKSYGISGLEMYEVSEGDTNQYWSTHQLASIHEDGMDSLSPLLDRRVETLEPLPMTDISEILPVDEVGKVFTKTLDLKKYLDIRSIKVEVE